MKTVRIGFRSFGALALMILCVLYATAQTDTSGSLDNSPLPQAVEPVNDFAGVLSEATKQRLNQQIKDFRAKTSPPVVLMVAIVKTTGGRPIEEYSLAVARGWKVGAQEDDNPGALLFIAVDDRRYFSQISRDLEDELPDGVAGQLQRQYLVPALKQGNYDKGVADTIDAYIRTIEQKSGKASPTPNGQKSAAPSTSIMTVVCCLVVLIVILIVIFSFLGRSRGKNRNDRDRWGGGFGGSGGGWIFLPGGGFGGGGSDSSSGWGGDGGGSSDWGGFGGGDFGGGGAGGDW